MHCISATVVVNAEEHSMLRHMNDDPLFKTITTMHTYILRINSYRMMSHIATMSSEYLDDRSVCNWFQPVNLKKKKNVIEEVFNENVVRVNR